MASGGSYRIQSSSLNKEFPAPPETTWNEQTISNGLNGIPINNSYRTLTWTFEDMLGCDYEDLATLFESQQSANAQLEELETDPYDASGAEEVYGTVVYSDFVIQSIAPRTRGLPLYQSVTVQIEVFVA
jgi:hypothetical protein